MDLTCNACGASMGKDDIHRDLAVIKCRACGSIFDLLPRPPEDHPDPPAQRKREKVAPPEKFDIARKHDALQISWKWYSHALIGLAFFCVAWDAFLIFWYNIAFSHEEIPWIMVVFPIGHLAVGIGLTYRTVAGFFNRTTLRATPDRLTIVHSPLPWLGNRNIPTRHLSQLFVKERARRRDNTTSYSYDLLAIKRDGSRLKLLKGLDEVEQALYLEQEIEEHLGIRDRPVAGEVKI
jgi:hypothetical protein